MSEPTTPPTDWKRLIVQLVLIKQKIAEVDREGLWQHHLPGVAASEGQVRAAEGRLGEPMDPLYRSFLLHANGWPAFYQTVDLFGADDLMGAERFGAAAKMLSEVEDLALEASGLDRGHLLPIAATTRDLDLFLMMKRSAPVPGAVVWFAGGEVERFPNFSSTSSP